MSRAQHIEGAEEIDVHDGLEGIRRHAKGGRGEVACGPGDQNIEIPECGVRILERAGYRRHVAYVGRCAEDFCSVFFQIGRRGSDLLG
jgi:hypothetical protein